MSQTTQNTEWFKGFVRDVVGRFLEFGCEVHAHNTDCLPTAKRQPAAVDLAKEVDVMIVVGGYESANTRHLRDIASEFCPAHHIERPEQLEEAWFQGVEKVGVTVRYGSENRFRLRLTSMRQASAFEIGSVM